MKHRIRAAARVALLPGIVLALLAPALPGSAATPSACTLRVDALAFSAKTVDASAGAAAVTLTWTVANSNTAAQSVGGVVTIRMRGDAPGSYVGLSYDVQYQYQDSPYGQASYVSGTPQRSTYTYTFAVPRYAATSTAKWAVSQVTARDELDDTLTAGDRALRRFGAVLTATESVDPAGPSYDISFDPSYTTYRRPYVYDNGTARVGYSLQIQDWQSGFWKGSLTATGPGGTTLTAGFELSDPLGEPHCGGHGGAQPPYDVFCGAVLAIPAGSPTGTWAVTAVTLTDNAGNTATYGGLDLLPFVLTRNATVTASSFTATPDPVDNWTQDVTVQLNMRVSGAQDGIAAIYVDSGLSNPIGSCPQLSTTPTRNADGAVSVPLRVYQGANGCTVDGIAVVTGAGNVALYGEEYGAPEPGVAIFPIPDVPPTVSAASLSVTTIPASQVTSTPVYLQADVVTPVAPVDGYDLTVYDSAGNRVTSSGGGLPAVLNGPVSIRVWLPDTGLAPGTYTIGFAITDAGRLTTRYGGPGDLPVPGGPLTLTITDG